MEKPSLPRMHELCLMQVRADRAMRAMIVVKLEAHKLTMMEWLALGVVAAGSKQGLSMSEIAAMLDVTLPQVTALVADLLELKLVKQKILASDHRGRQVPPLQGVLAHGRRARHPVMYTSGSCASHRVRALRSP